MNLETSKIEDKQIASNVINKLEQEYSNFRTDSDQQHQSLRAKFESKDAKMA